MAVMSQLEKLVVNGPVMTWLHRDVGVPAMLRLARLPLEGPLLELGCGQGATTEGLLRHAPGLEVTALDYDAAQVDRAQRRLGGRARVVQGDAAALAFPSASFGTVVEMNAFHHVPAWREAQREAFRVLRPGGQFLFMDYTRAFVAGALAARSFQPGAFSATEFADGLAEAGFSPVVLRGGWVVTGCARRAR